MKKIFKFLFLGILILVIAGFISVKNQQNKPKTFEPYKITDQKYLERVKSDLSSSFAIDLELNKEVLFGQLGEKDAKINLLEYKKYDELNFPGAGKLKADENSKILYFHLKVKRLSGEYHNHIVNSNILGLACDKNFSYCYSLDFRKREPEEGIITGQGERDFYIAGFVPKNEKLNYGVFYYTFYQKDIIGASPSESFYFAKFKLY
ncbi:hypothetical protein HRbin35_00568 [bacterium HR35]|nr:hypothetical protein HRbin35_00568 [bacterium HR35]